MMAKKNNEQRMREARRESRDILSSRWLATPMAKRDAAGRLPPKERVTRDELEKQTNFTRKLKEILDYTDKADKAGTAEANQTLMNKVEDLYLITSKYELITGNDYLSEAKDILSRLHRDAVYNRNSARQFNTSSGPSGALRQIDLPPIFKTTKRSRRGAF